MAPLPPGSSAADPETTRQLRVLTIGTLGLVIIAAPFVFQYAWLGVTWMSAAVAATAVFALASLAWTQHDGNTQRGGYINVGLLFALIAASNIASGGFYDPNMSWLYVVPILAALTIDARAGWVFTVLAAIAILGFWMTDEVLGWVTPNQIPAAERAVQSLANRVSAVIGIGVGIAALASRDAFRRRLLAAANEKLRAEMEHRERVHDQLVCAQRLATLGELAATVGHEVNNPLTYVITNLELLQDDLETLPESVRGESQSMVSEALDGALRVQAIVGNLKALSREPSTEPLVAIDPQVAVNRALVMSPATAQVCVDFEAVGRVLVREGPLVQVLVNLFSNARQAMEHTQDSRLTLTAQRHGQMLQIDISDNGPGVSEAIAARIFEPFFTTRHNVGTGLGLPICRTLAEGMGGTLSLLHSDTGATFRLELAAAQGTPTTQILDEIGGHETPAITVTRIEPTHLPRSQGSPREPMG